MEMKKNEKTTPGLVNQHDYEYINGNVFVVNEADCFDCLLVSSLS